jgi:hypothetical protein
MEEERRGRPAGQGGGDGVREAGFGLPAGGPPPAARRPGRPERAPEHGAEGGEAGKAGLGGDLEEQVVRLPVDPSHLDAEASGVLLVAAGEVAHPHAGEGVVGEHRPARPGLGGPPPDGGVGGRLHGADLAERSEAVEVPGGKERNRDPGGDRQGDEGAPARRTAQEHQEDDDPQAEDAPAREGEDHGGGHGPGGAPGGEAQRAPGFGERPVEGEGGEDHEQLGVKVRVADGPGDPHVIDAAGDGLDCRLAEAEEAGAERPREELEPGHCGEQGASAHHDPDDPAQGGGAAQEHPGQDRQRRVLEQVLGLDAPGAEVGGDEEGGQHHAGVSADEGCGPPAARGALAAGEAAEGDAERDEGQQGLDEGRGAVEVGGHVGQIQDGEGSHRAHRPAGVGDHERGEDEGGGTGHGQHGLGQHHCGQAGGGPSGQGRGGPRRRPPGGREAGTRMDAGDHPALEVRRSAGNSVTVVSRAA